MFDESQPPSPSSALVALAPLDPEWQPILHVSNQVVLYNPTSHALSIRKHSGSGLERRDAGSRCPYCHRFIHTDGNDEEDTSGDSDVDDFEDELWQHPRSRASNYFQLLEIANETASRPASPPGTRTRTIPNGGESSQAGAFRANNMAEGYFKAFFKEECRLGMGANGSVFLCQHVLDENPLGHFAVKKIAVGQSHAYLLNILREVRLLERLHHPNIITYHHAWLETCQFSSFGPQVPTLHVLMQWAEGGSLDEFIDARLGRSSATHFPHIHSSSGTASPVGSPAAEVSPPHNPQSRTARIRAFRALQRAPPDERERLRRELGLTSDVGGIGHKPPDLKAVHLLSAEEVRSLFGDVVSGLAFLHEKSILHLDLKPGNVLLTWDEGQLIPRAMLSDFGTSQDMLKSRARSGNTGTLEYSSPESLPSPTGILMQVDSKSDMWSVGMILHKLLFFRLPYPHASDGSANDQRDERDTADMLESEVQTYAGFKSTNALVTAFESRRLPRAYLVLLESLLNVTPPARPSSERVLAAIREGRLDPLPLDTGAQRSSSISLVPVALRRVFTPPVFFTETVSESPDLHASVSQEPDISVTDPPAPTSEKGKVPLLDSAPSVPPSTSGVWARTVHVGGRQLHVRIPRVLWLRTVKSCVLVLKVLDVARMCPNARPHPLFSAAVLGLAVVDTWFDGFVPTLVFGALHVGLVRLAGQDRRWCA
ncbi:uncharacterized protein FIBRA_02844 [Fibroporia radiculosa]|uniref:non-specific serine/threonine protein kinase n=1 Tax=Fibroporia radiculosa TaxID=599839 RepID=J4HVK9_9APHY|nr:uncharacterized protein FIBRA_02844 [Fibroporia radiculosa]CCM00802.1 predicted protein [Fibroporia radiculosa]